MNVIEANHPIIMRRDHWKYVPVYSLPPGYSLRHYIAGDEARWVDIMRAAFNDGDITAQFFTSRFRNNEMELERRQYFLCDSSGTAIGTATAWWDDEFEDGDWGRVRCVAIDPHFQGRHLMRPLISALCHRFQELGHGHVFLDTSTKRSSAIKMYWRFGFRPYLKNREDEKIWKELKEYLELPSKKE